MINIAYALRSCLCYAQGTPTPMQPNVEGEAVLQDINSNGSEAISLQAERHAAHQQHLF